jgi:uncharacterized integral membrane protein
LRYLKAILFFALAIAGILFGISNQDNASVHFFWYFSKSYPLYLVLFACFFAGTVIAILYGFVSGSEIKGEERHLNKYLDELKEKFKRAQASAVPRSLSGNTNGPVGRSS